MALTPTALVFWPASPATSAAALRWYNQGVKAIRDGTCRNPVRALERSVKESPHYPLAHASLAEAWFELDSTEQASQEMLQATGPDASGYRINSRSRERLQALQYTVTRDFVDAATSYEHLAQSAPPAERPRSMVDFGRALERARQPRKAMRVIRERCTSRPQTPPERTCI